MKERISIQELVALNNTPKAKALILKYGYKPAKSYNDLTFKLIKFTKDYREEALKELANLHPHKELILNYECKQKPTEQVEVITSKDVKSNFESDRGNECQCTECRKMRMMDFQKFSNFEGEMKNPNTNDSLSLSVLFPMVAISGLVALAFYVAFNQK